MRFINYPFLFLKKKMAPNFLDLATTLENLGATWLLEKKVNFVPCMLIRRYACGITHFLQLKPDGNM